MPRFHLDRRVRNLERVLEVFRLAPRRDMILYMWRCVVPADWPANDASRSRNYAGRWHHPADSEALYCAATPELATAEATDRRLPGVYQATMAPLELHGRQVVRLEDVASRLPWSLEHLLSDGLGYARAILVGVMACRTGIDILVAPSARQRGAEIAVCFMKHDPFITVGDGYRTTLIV